MKVKDLINYLQKQNQEDFVGMEDLGSDTGDWFDIDDINTSNLKILSYDNVIKRIKKDNPNWYGEDDAKKFIAKYKEVPNLAIMKPVIYMRVSKKEMDENKINLINKKFKLNNNYKICNDYEELLLLNKGSKVYFYSLDDLSCKFDLQIENYVQLKNKSLLIYSLTEPIFNTYPETPTEKLMKLNFILGKSHNNKNKHK